MLSYDFYIPLFFTPLFYLLLKTISNLFILFLFDKKTQNHKMWIQFDYSRKTSYRWIDNKHLLWRNTCNHDRLSKHQDYREALPNSRSVWDKCSSQVVSGMGQTSRICYLCRNRVCHFRSKRSQYRYYPEFL